MKHALRGFLESLGIIRRFVLGGNNLGGDENIGGCGPDRVAFDNLATLTFQLETDGALREKTLFFRACDALL